MDDERAESKLSKFAPPDPPEKPQPDDEDVDDELYQSGWGATAPVVVSYFLAHSAAAPAATANGTYAV
jgi:hypothetical protein